MRSTAQAVVRDVFAFGGVEIELLSNERLELPASHVGCISRELAGTCTARVVCSWRADASLAGEQRGARQIQLSTAGDIVTGPGVRLRLSQTGARCWAASARVAPEPDAAGALLEALAASVSELDGGLIVHAAGVQLDEKAYLFIGPSGAGKTTAAGQVFGGRSFAVDRVAISMARGDTQAWALPGGTRPAGGVDCNSGCRLPVGAVLRVVKSSVLRVETLATHRAVAVVRESTLMTRWDPRAEEQRLSAIERLALAVPVVRLETPLGTPLAHSLRSLETGRPDGRVEVG